MREILTVIAAFLVVVLTAALVAPPFIDWTAHRAQIESGLEKAFAARVTLVGPISLRVLPQPSLAVGGARVERAGFSLQTQDVRLELALTPLFSGQLQLSEIALQAPVISVDPEQFVASASQDKISISRLTAQDAKVLLAGAPAFERVDFTASAESLSGPYRAEGVWRAPTGSAHFQLTTSAIEAGSLRGKLALDQGSAEAKLDVEGKTAFVQGGWTFDGAGVATGGGDSRLWRAAFSAHSAAGVTNFETIEMRLGDEARGASLKGAGQYSAEGGLNLSLAARNLDLDHFRQDYDSAQSASTILFLDRSVAGVPLQARLRADSARLFSQTLTASDLLIVKSAQSDASDLRIKFSANLPAQSKIAYEGAVGFTREALIGSFANFLAKTRFDGLCDFSTSDIAQFMPIATFDDKRGTGGAVVRPFSAFSLSGRVRGEDGVISVKSVSAQLNRSLFLGDFVWRPAPSANERPSLSLRLESPALDLDGLPEIGLLSAFDPALDLDILFDAQAIKIARLGASAVKAGTIHAALTRDNDGLVIKDVSIADLGGANFRASGAVLAGSGKLSLQLDAEKLDDFAAIAQKIAPGPASRALVQRARALSPAHLALSLDTAAYTVSRAQIGGRAGGAILTGVLTPAPYAGPSRGEESLQDSKAQDQKTRDQGRAFEGKFMIESSEAAVLLEQLGFAALPLRGMGPARLEAAFQGPFSAANTQAAFFAPGVALDYRGLTHWSVDQTACVGRISLKTQNIAPLLQILGASAFIGLGGAPMQAEAELSLNGERLRLSDLRGLAGGTHFSGDLSRESEGVWKGDLAMDALSAPALAAAVLGPRQELTAGRIWSDAPFAPQAMILPDADIAISAERFDFSGFHGASVRMGLKLSNNGLAFSHFFMFVGGGSIAGEGVLQRIEANALAKARVTLDGVQIGAGPFATRVSGVVDLSSGGGSEGALINSLSGGGEIAFNGLRLAQTSMKALDETIEHFEAASGLFEPSAIGQTLNGALERDAQDFLPFKADIRLTAGRVGIGPVSAPIASAAAGALPVILSANLDLRDLSLSAVAKIRAAKPQDWEGADPAINVSWNGPIAQPLRRVDADMLAASLVARAIERDVARNAALEADMRERAFFNRRLKFDRHLYEDRRAEARRRAEELARLHKEKLDSERRSLEAQDGGGLSQGLRRRPAPPSLAPRLEKMAPDPSTFGRY